jgi:hypothetical protein
LLTTGGQDTPKAMRHLMASIKASRDQDDAAKQRRTGDEDAASAPPASASAPPKKKQRKTTAAGSAPHAGQDISAMKPMAGESLGDFNRRVDREHADKVRCFSLFYFIYYFIYIF